MSTSHIMARSAAASGILLPRSVEADAHEIEAQGGEAWCKHFFPYLFSRPFASYQKDFWDWGWQIEPNTYYRPRIECEPRGVGKSTSAEVWVASLVARKKRQMIGYVSLNETKATKHFDSIKSLLESDKLLTHYPHCKPKVQKLKDTAAQWSKDAIVTESGAMIVPLTLLGSSRGWKSSTGSRFDCFPAGTMIKTEVGNVAIEAFPLLKYIPKVYAFNHKTQQVELQKVEVWRKKDARGLIEITTRQGRKLRCTPEHRIFVPSRGYVQAQQVRVGEAIDVLPEMLRMERPEVASVPQVQRSGVRDVETDQDVFSVSEGLYGNAGRRCQASQEGDSAQFLFSEVCPSVVATQTDTKMQGVRKRDDGVLLRTQVLQRCVPSLQSTENAGSDFLPVVQRDVYTVQQSPEVLFSHLCQQFSFSADGGQGQLTLPNRERTVEAFSRYASFGTRKGRQQMCGVPNGRNDNIRPQVGCDLRTQQLRDSPHRPRHNAQLSGESDFSVSSLSYVLPSLERDEVSMVRHLRAGSVSVYDLQVAGCHNFFANEILVHNCIVLDDIDELGQSPEFTKKLIELLKGEILAAGDDTTIVLMPQNLIYRDSICAQIQDHRADILSDRIFCGPFPLLKWYDAEKVNIEGDGTGAKEWVITSGEPYDEAISIEYAQRLLNKFGKATFDRECQQLVTQIEDDKDFREWSEIYHIITRSEFQRVMDNEPIWNDKRHRLQIPSRWNVGLGFDWGTTKGHPSSVAFVARPSRLSPLHDSHFVFAEVVKPEFPLDSFETPELVSPGRVAQAVQDTLNEWNVVEGQIETRLMSHEASAAMNTMAIDLKPDVQQFFSKWKAQKGSGVPQIQNLLEIDYTKDHPFRLYPQGYTLNGEDVGGERVKGCPRLFFIVEDGQGELCLDSAGHLYVAGARDAGGFARARFEMPLYSYRNTGSAKIDDDFVDALRGLMNVFGVEAQDLTREESIQKYMPPHLINDTRPYRAERDLEMIFARKEAAKLADDEDDRIQEFDLYG